VGDRVRIHFILYYILILAARSEICLFGFNRRFFKCI
jgi:hypothetical protein